MQKDVDKVFFGDPFPFGDFGGGPGMASLGLSREVNDGADRVVASG